MSGNVSRESFVYHIITPQHDKNDNIILIEWLDLSRQTVLYNVKILFLSFQVKYF